MTHGYLPGSNINNHLWDKERIETRRAITRSKVHHFFLEGNNTSNAATEDYAYSIRIYIFFRNPRIFYSFISCNDCKLTIPVHFTGFFLVDVICRIKVFNLTSKSGFKFRNVKLLDIVTPTYTIFQVLPIFINSTSQWS